MGFKYIEHIARNGVPIKCKPADPDSGIICCTIDMYAHIYIILYIYIHSHCLDMSGLEFAYLAQPSRAVHFNLRNNKCVWSLSRDVHIFQSNGGHWRPSPWPSKSLQRPGGIISAQSWLQFNIASSFHLRSRDPPRPGGKGRGSRSPHDSRHETCGKRVGNVWETCRTRALECPDTGLQGLLDQLIAWCRVRILKCESHVLRPCFSCFGKLGRLWKTVEI